MQLSARNQLKGKVKSIKEGAVMGEVLVALDNGDNEVVSAITMGSIQRLKLKVGSPVTVVIKATEVMLGVD